MKAILTILIAVTAASFCSAIEISPPEGIFLGERRVDFTGQTERIITNKTDGPFRAVQFLVNQNDIELDNVVVIFGSGVRQRIGTGLSISEGTQSRIIRLTRGDQLIRSIEFSYKSVGNWPNGTAAVLVYGIR